MISEEEFQDHINQFVETSKQLMDGWFLDSIRNQTFIRKKSVVVVHGRGNDLRGNNGDARSLPDSGHCQGQSDSVDGQCQGQSDSVDGQCQGQLDSVDGQSDCCLEEEDFCEDDTNCMPARLPSETSQQSIHYEYHVVYSQCYAVPVLYLNVFNSTGQRLSLDEVWKLCPETFQPYLHDNKWTTLTQQEHPLLGTPYLMLHPCHTADLMAQVNRGSPVEMKGERNYLVTWLSTVGPLVGLKVPEQYVIKTNSM